MAVYRGDDLVSANVQIFFVFFWLQSQFCSPCAAPFASRSFLMLLFKQLSSLRIVLVEAIMGALVQRTKMTTFQGLLVLSIFPLSLVLVATLEAFGLD